MKMNIEDFRTYCLNKKGVTENFPFDETTLVFKVMGKMFALTRLEQQPAAVNLKCDPEKAVELRETFDGIIIPGYHMNKKHWNTVVFDAQLPQKVLLDLVDHSYDLVVKGLSKKLKQELKDM